MKDIMEKLNSIRRTNLRSLVRGSSATSVAKAAGYTSPSYLSQMIGPNATKKVSEESARKIEEGLGLPHLYLDQERDEYDRLVTGGDRRKQDKDTMSMVDPAQFSKCAAIASNEMVVAGVKTSADKLAGIVGLMMHNADQSDEGLRTLAAQLVKISA